MLNESCKVHGFMYVMLYSMYLQTKAISNDVKAISNDVSLLEMIYTFIKVSNINKYIYPTINNDRTCK